MFHRVLFTIATAACLTGVYAVYAVMARPFVVVPELPETSIEPKNRAAAQRPVENVRVAETYLAELHWAAKSQYTLRAGQAFIYTNEWSPSSPWIEFAPFAMVWLQKDNEGREQAISLVSDSARLKFASPFDTINPNPGRVISAVLDGTVQVKGPNGLAIAGKQFIFDESAPSLVSTHPVQFEYDSHSGEGRSLNMKLIPAEGPPSNDRPHVYGIRSIRLDAGPHPTKGYMRAKLDVRIPQNDSTRLVHIQCERDLELDIPSNKILFSKRVRARSPSNGTDFDELECDELLLEFQPSNPKSVATGAEPMKLPEESNNQFQQLSSDLVFKRLTANGRMVKLKSTQHQVEGVMQHLVFDAVQHRLKLSDARDVAISQKRSRLTVPEVEVDLPEDNSLPPREIRCLGKGRLDVMNDDRNEVAFVATWVEFLRQSRDRETGLDLIELQKTATFRQPTQKVALGAGLIRLWLDQIPLGQQIGGDPPSAPIEPRLHHMVAERDVALFSPQLLITTAQLDVQFVNPPVSSAGTQPRTGLQQVSLQETVIPVHHPARSEKGAKVGNTNARRSQATLAPKQASPEILQVSHTRSERGSLGEAIEIPSTTDPVEKVPDKASLGIDVKPPEVTADRISVRMQNVAGQKQPELVEVETQGRVKITQRNGPGEAPMTATGDRLRLTRNGPDREVVHLFGNPAHLRDRGMHVEGREVHLDREANRVWVKGNGLLQLPVPPGAQIASLGQATADPDLDVWWAESMEFDGRTARFVGKVLAELGLSKMWCEQMDVNLASPIAFSGPSSDQRPGLQSIHCRESVSFQSSQMKENKLVHVLRGKVAELSHNHEQGISNAQGPGEFQVWQRSEKRQASPLQQQMQANRPISAVTSEWDYTRIHFKGRMSGNVVLYDGDGSLNRQTSRFRNSVIIVHGPVTRPGDTIDADHLPTEAACMRCEELEFSHHAKGPNISEAYQLMVGTGNAQIEGRGFYANADEISFDGSKGLYILRALGNQNATIAQDPARGRRREASGRRIDFIPALKRIVVDLVSGANGP